MKTRLLLVVVVIAGALAVTWSLVGGRDADVPTPGRGRAVATFLADGRPVFVVTDRAGRTSVVDAISTHRPYGVGYLVGWCRSAGTFDDPFHGSRFTADGRYLMGPASTDLPTYPFESVSGDVVIVGPATTPTRRTVGGAPSVPTVCSAAGLVEPAFRGATWACRWTP
jgi:hypothetical protein